jgi:hypothetical protein
MTKFKGAGFMLSNGKQIYVKAGPRVPRKIKKKIKEWRKINFAKMFRSMLNIEVPKLPEQEVIIPK